jgi:glyoxalase family protein
MTRLRKESMAIQGLHHITLICSNAQRTVDFYVGVLGLRLIKQTVNFDDPGSYHLYFGDELGHPGSAITFFEWPGARRGNPGIGGTRHFALTVADETGLVKWQRRLADLGIAVQGPVAGPRWASIFLQDPDGTAIEIATHDAVLAARLDTAIWNQPVPEITCDMALSRGMHHITAVSSNLKRTDAFYSGLLGLEPISFGSATADADQRLWGLDGRPGTLISYQERDQHQEPRARYGAGQTHHFALAVPDAAEQLEWRAKLVAAGLQVSPVMDRIYFKSIYTNDPDGHIVELATLGPGFAVDEPAEELGTHLELPPWLERYRGEIGSSLRPIAVPAWRMPEPA